MTTTNNGSHHLIRKVAESRDMSVEMTFSREELYSGSTFREYYLTPEHFDFGHTEEELEIMGAALIKLAGSLPISTYSLLEWIATCPFFDGNVIRDFAADHFGMEHIESPIKRTRRKAA